MGAGGGRRARRSGWTGTPAAVRDVVTVAPSGLAAARALAAAIKRKDHNKVLGKYLGWAFQHQAKLVAQFDIATWKTPAKREIDHRHNGDEAPTEAPAQQPQARQRPSRASRRLILSRDPGPVQRCSTPPRRPRIASAIRKCNHRQYRSPPSPVAPLTAALSPRSGSANAATPAWTAPTPTKDGNPLGRPRQPAHPLHRRFPARAAPPPYHSDTRAPPSDAGLGCSASSGATHRRRTLTTAPLRAGVATRRGIRRAAAAAAVTAAAAV